MIFATIGADIPQDLLLACEGYQGPVGWTVDRATPRADQWLESRFAPWTRSVLEDWAAGAFDGLDAILFSRGDDNSQRLYYYACELRERGLLKGPEPLIFDVARINRPTSTARTINAVRTTAARLGLDDAALEAGIAKANAQRGTAPTALPGPVCFLTGTAPPDRRIHAMIEAAGWSAAGETLADQWQRAGATVEAGTGDPAAAIGRAVHADSFGPRGFHDRASATLAEAQKAGAKAAILWFTEEEEGLVWHAPAQQKALEAAGIAVLPLTRCSWLAQDGIDTKIAAFLAEQSA